MKFFETNYKELKKVAIKKSEKLKEKQGNNKIIMGADLSAKSTGIAIINKEKELLFMDKIYIPSFSNTKNSIRILCFVIGVNRIIKKYKPECVVIEDTFSSNIKTHSSLENIHGIFNLLMILNNIKVKYIHPGSAKSFIKKGCRTKEEIFEILKKRYNLNVNFKEHNDGVDALVMALNFFNDKAKSEE